MSPRPNRTVLSVLPRKGAPYFVGCLNPSSADALRAARANGAYVEADRIVAAAASELVGVDVAVRDPREAALLGREITDVILGSAEDVEEFVSALGPLQAAAVRRRWRRLKRLYP